MINTILFDLDGTLLPLEWEVFEKEYFKSLAVNLSEHFEPQMLVKYIWKSTMKMIENTGGNKTNEQVFYEDFLSLTGKDIETIGPVFNDFYAGEFDKLKRFTRSEDYIVDAVNLLYKRGYELVIATNPVFPMTVIKKRISWAGLDEKMFKYITCFEEMHHCKPNLEYFKEILDIIGREPEECLMVGNDVDEDIIVSRLGVKTFLVEDFMINTGGTEPAADYKGFYKDFYKFVCDNLSSLT